VSSSHDGGATWTDLAVPLPAGGAPLDLTVDPNSDSTLYTQSAKSMDGGLTWSALGRELKSAPSVRPGSPAVLFGVAFPGNVLKSTDGGASWTASSNGIPVNASDGRVIISPADANVMYYMYDGSPYPTTYGSTDGGATWTTRPAPTVRLSVHPTQPLTVYCAGDAGVWKSIDGGFTWAHTLNVSLLFNSVVPASSTVVYAATSVGAVYVSTDGATPGRRHRYRTLSRRGRCGATPRSLAPSSHRRS